MSLRDFKALEVSEFRTYTLAEETLSDNTEAYSVFIDKDDSERIIIDCKGKKEAKNLFEILCKDTVE